jgi:hypothetical protein
MISFRFHVVSLTAVFLAIAIGVLVGTTYVDRAVVDSLENRVDRVSSNLDRLRSENGALARDLDRFRGYAGSSADFAVSHRLTDTPVLLVAGRGVDDDVAGATLTLLRRAGAIVPGIAWLEERWGLEGDEDREALIAATGIQGTGARGSVRSAGLDALVGSFGVAAEGTDPALATAVIDGLVEAGFVSVDAEDDSAAAPTLASLAGVSPRVLVLTTTDISDPVGPTLSDLVARTSGSGLPTVAAEAYRERSDGPDRGQALSDAIDEDVRDRIVWVDDAEAPEGRVAAVLGLDEVAAGRFGHYGYGAGADAVLPAWTAP